jgi:hypothetical protein
MRKGPLMGDGSLPAGDVLFMAHLTLEGKFIEVPHQLFFRRMHGSSSSRDRGNDLIQQDFWSAGRRGFVRPCWRTHKALLEGVARADVSAKEKMRLIAFLLRRMYWHRREVMREVLPRSDSPHARRGLQ